MKYVFIIRAAIGKARCHAPLIVVSALLFLVFAPGVNARSARKLALHDMNGNPTRLSDFDGQVVVVNFWATWCGPCREELPRFSAMARDYAPSHVAFVMISIDDARKIEKIRSFVMQQQIKLPVWIGGSADMVEHFSSKGVVPATLVLDQHGEIVRTVNGEARDEDVKEAVDWLLSGRKGPRPQAVIKRY